MSSILKTRQGTKSFVTSEYHAACIGGPRLPSAHPTRLRQNILDHLSVKIRQPAIDAIVANGQFFVVDAEEVQDGRMNVVDRRRIVAVQRLVPPLVARAVADAALD